MRTFIRAIVTMLAVLGLVIICWVLLVVMLGAAAGIGYVLGDAWFDNGIAGAVVGVIACITYTAIKFREPITNLRHTIPDAVRHHVLQRDEFCCQHCGATEHLEIDHIRPVTLGGDNDINNLQVLCGTCNRRKSNHYVG